MTHEELENCSVFRWEPPDGYEAGLITTIYRCIPGVKFTNKCVGQLAIAILYPGSHPRIQRGCDLWVRGQWVFHSSYPPDLTRQEMLDWITAMRRLAGEDDTKYIKWVQYGRR